MSLNEKILESINTELPAMVAGELKNFIADAEANKAALDRLRAEHQEAMAELTKFRALNAQASSVTAREVAVTARERAVELTEAIHKVKAECNDQRVGEIRELVRTVFQSNRLDYSLSLGIPVKDPYGSSQIQQTSGTITKTP